MKVGFIVEGGSGPGTAGLAVDCSSRLLQYSGCRCLISIPRPVLESLDQAADRLSMEKLITGQTVVHFMGFLFLAGYVR